MQTTSLAELKTGKEKLALINQVLENIDKISTSLDNTRIDEIVGLKENVKSLYDDTLKLKNEVLTAKNETLSNKTSTDSILSEVTRINAEVSKVKDSIIVFNTSKSEIENKMNGFKSDLNTSKSEIENKISDFNNDFNTSKSEIESKINDFNAELETTKNEFKDKINAFNGNYSISKSEAEAFFNELGNYKGLLLNFSENINEVETIIARIQGSVNQGKDFAVVINSYTSQALAVQKVLESLKEQVETMKEETSQRLVLLENFNEQFRTLYETKRVDFKAFVEAERNYTKLEFKELSRQNLSTIYAHLFSLENLLHEKGIISLENQN